MLLVFIAYMDVSDCCTVTPVCLARGDEIDCVDYSYVASAMDVPN